MCASTRRRGRLNLRVDRWQVGCRGRGLLRDELVASGPRCLSSTSARCRRGRSNSSLLPRFSDTSGRGVPSASPCSSFWTDRRARPELGLRPPYRAEGGSRPGLAARYREAASGVVVRRAADRGSERLRLRFAELGASSPAGAVRGSSRARRSCRSRLARRGRYAGRSRRPRARGERPRPAPARRQTGDAIDPIRATARGRRTRSPWPAPSSRSVVAREPSPPRPAC